MNVRNSVETIRGLAFDLSDELCTAGSLFRIGCWTLVFFILILCVASRLREFEAKPGERNAHSVQDEGFLKVSLQGYEPLHDRHAAPHAFRIVVLGSSEAFDFREYNYSLGSSILRLAPQYTSTKIEVIEKSMINLSRWQKKSAVQQATMLDADVIVVSLPLFQIIRPPKIGEFGDLPLRDALLAAAETPSGTLDRLMSAVWPDYRANLAWAIRLTPPAAGRADAPLPSTNLPPNETVNDKPPVLGWDRKVVEEDIAQIGHVRTEAVAYVFDQVAQPSIEAGVPIVLVASPVDTALLSGASLALIREDAQLLDKIAEHLQGTSVTVFNGLQLKPAESGEFLNFDHLKNHDLLASALLESLTEKGVIPRNGSKAENQDSVQTPR